MKRVLEDVKIEIGNSGEKDAENKIKIDEFIYNFFDKGGKKLDITKGNVKSLIKTFLIKYVKIDTIIKDLEKYDLKYFDIILSLKQKDTKKPFDLENVFIICEVYDENGKLKLKKEFDGEKYEGDDYVFSEIFLFLKENR